MQKSSRNSVTFASREVSQSAPSLSYQGRLAFWFNYFLRREVKLAKETVGLIKPYAPKVRNNKATQLLLPGPCLSGTDSTSGASNA